MDYSRHLEEMGDCLNRQNVSLKYGLLPELPQDLDEPLKLALIDAEQVLSATTANVREALQLAKREWACSMSDFTGDRQKAKQLEKDIALTLEQGEEGLDKAYDCLEVALNLTSEQVDALSEKTDALIALQKHLEEALDGVLESQNLSGKAQEALEFAQMMCQECKTFIPPTEDQCPACDTPICPKCSHCSSSCPMWSEGSRMEGALGNEESR